MSTISYWQKTSDRAVVTSAELPATSDVVIIGAGVHGASAAYYAAKMAERSGQRVTLLEQELPAFGASGRNGGFVSTGTADGYASTAKRVGRDVAKHILGLSMRSRSLVQNIIAEDGVACDYRVSGKINYALSEASFAAMQTSADMMREDGLEVEMLDHKALQTLVDTPLSEEIEGGKYVAGDGLLHSAKFVVGVTAAAQRHGATVCLNTKVLNMSAEGNTVQIETNRGTISAGAVIVTVNAWSSTVLPKLKGIITPVRGQIFSYAPIAPVLRQGMGVEMTPTGEYWQQTLDGSIVIGGCRADAPDREWDILTDGLHDGVQSSIEKVLPRLFPRLGPLNVAHRWSGPMAFTPDYLPVLDHASELPNTWVSGGFCGHGMVFGLPFGELLAEAALTHT
ncbi:MAG: FAD-binding oxidoreductase, partial [Anaerolineae bacterium]|nr:FAD-binding oxidoreductase [Anaerolineae bacterium]